MVAGPLTQHDFGVQDLRAALGSRIRDLRKRRGMSQEELADRARLHWTYLSDLERGRQTPTMDVVNRLARGCGVTLAEFFAPLHQQFRVRSRKQRSDAT